MIAKYIHFSFVFQDEWISPSWTLAISLAVVMLLPCLLVLHARVSTASLLVILAVWAALVLIVQTSIFIW